MAEEKNQLAEIVLPLLLWFRDNARVLPWRSQPTAYRVWVSEIMLQQTRVAAVLDYFQRFTQELPTVAALAQCPEERLMKLWQGLGYYSRARNLQKAAQVIETTHGGVFPSDYDAIRALPGIGDYTAGAVASIAFGVPVPAVDGNVLRVIARVTGDRSDITLTETKKMVRQRLLEIMPQGDAAAFNQSLMELGALVCVPNGAPLCDRCPLSGQCVACRESLTGEIPVKTPKKPRRIEERTVYLLYHQGKVALRQRPKKGLLAGLWEFPNETAQGETLTDWNLTPTTLWEEGKSKHIFTHIEWRMQGVAAQLPTAELPEGWVWANGVQLREQYAIPNAFDAFLRRVPFYGTAEEESS